MIVFIVINEVNCLINLYLYCENVFARYLGVLRQTNNQRGRKQRKGNHW